MVQLNEKTHTHGKKRWNLKFYFCISLNWLINYLAMWYYPISHMTQIEKSIWYFKSIFNGAKCSEKSVSIQIHIPYDQYQNMTVDLKLLVLQTCFGPVIMRLVLHVYNCWLFLSKYSSNIHLNLSTKMEKKPFNNHI